MPPSSSPTRFDSSPDAAWAAVLADVRAAARSGDPTDGLVRLAEHLRPADRRRASAPVADLARHLEATPDDGAFVGRLLRRALGTARAVHTLTDAGIPSSHQGFWSELAGRVSRRVLPPPPDPSALGDRLRRVFPHDDDHVWIERTPTADWLRLMTAAGLTASAVRGVDADLALAIRVLAHHVASLGLSPEITERLPHLEGPASPFLAISAAVLRYLESFENDVADDEEPLLDEALVQLAACREAVEVLRAEKDAFGTNLTLTLLSYRLLVQIERLDVLLHLTEPVERDFQGSAVRLFRSLVRAVNTRNHVLPHVRDSADLLARQVTEFAARKGSRYITRTPREYAMFFVSSLGGGLIVAVFALAKVLLDRLDVPLATEAFLFGVNYAVCFVLIYVTGATLATKQPAMTANTIARTLGGTEEHDLNALQALVVRTWRSQFVSFAGNLLMALPAALLLTELYRRVTGTPPASPDKAAALLEGLHPWRSGALAYAAVAGVFLFAAGLVSGYVDNRNRYGRIPDRLARHPLLHRLAGPQRAAAFAAFVDRNLGILTGNVFLGFCLGSAGTLGEIFGVPFDIRHIAFASAHFGLAADILGTSVPTALLVQIALGVGLIGLVNFVVSFGLSLALAMESRRVTFRETRVLLRGLLGHLRHYPLDYFFPPLRRRAAPPS